MKNINVNKTFKGKDGEVYINGVLLAECEKFEAKAVPDYEEIKVKGKSYRVPQGYSVSGTLTSLKVDNTFSNLLGAAIKNCEVPEIEIIGTETNKDVSERVKFTGVTFDELALISFENGASHKDEMAFQSVDFDYIDR